MPSNHSLRSKSLNIPNLLAFRQFLRPKATKSVLYENGEPGYGLVVCPDWAFQSTEEPKTMDKNVLFSLLIFIGILYALNVFLHLHISIIGSLILTLALNFAFGLFRSRP